MNWFERQLDPDRYEVERKIEEARRSGNPVLHVHSYNQRELPETIGDLRLIFLSLDFPELTALPVSITKIRELETLSLRVNKLEELPEWIGRLSELTILHIQGYRLTALPRSIGGLHKLKVLSVRKCRLTSLPEFVGQLQLTELDASDNQLMSLPVSLMHVKSLQGLYLHNNPGLNLPAEVLGPTRQDVTDKKALPAKPVDILDHYFRVHAGDSLLKTSRPIPPQQVSGGIDPTESRHKRGQSEDRDGQQVVHHHYYGVSENEREGSTMESDVGKRKTLIISGGTFIQSSVAIQQRLVDSYKVVQQATNDALQQALKHLCDETAKLLEKIDDERKAAKVQRDLKDFVTEAVDPEPRRGILEVTRDGLVEAAKTVGEMAGPIIAVLKLIMDLVGV